MREDGKEILQQTVAHGFGLSRVPPGAAMNKALAVK